MRKTKQATHMMLCHQPPNLLPKRGDVDAENPPPHPPRLKRTNPKKQIKS
jgi:hypothetical protein